jgi:hypothetical protein
MADELTELLSRIQDLLAVDSTTRPADTDREKRSRRFPETSRFPNGKRQRLRFTPLDKDGLEGVRRLTSDQFSDLSTFEESVSSISELALDADEGEIGDTFSCDNLFIIPIVDEEREVIGRSVFAFVR